MTNATERLRGLIAGAEPTVVPLVLDPFSALQAEEAGFQAGYLSGGMLGYVKTCTEANLSLTQMCDAVVEIRAATAMPLILDGQCGWGDPMHVRHTVRMAEAAGAAAIELEDQLQPKRAHHHIGREHLIPTEMMVEKIRVAAQSRRDPNFVLIARTNACRTDNLDEALRRAEAYRRAGADMILVLQTNPEEARMVGERIEGPLFYMMTGGVQSIGMSVSELNDLGYKLLGDVITPFYARVIAMRQSYEALAQLQMDPTVRGAYAEETTRIHATIDLETLLGIERRSVGE